MATTTSQPEQQTIEYIHQGENAMLDLTRTMAENWARVLRTAGGVGSQAGSLPTPTQIIDRTYAAAHQMLDNQHQFALSMVGAFEPAVRATEQVADSLAEKARSDAATQNRPGQSGPSA